jgi:hypothetical protein
LSLHSFANFIVIITSGGLGALASVWTEASASAESGQGC